MIAPARNARRARGHEHAQSREGERAPRQRAGDREHEALRHEEANEAAASRAERGAQRQLFLPRFRAHQQEIREVRACNQQHDDNRELQYPERLADAADHVGLEAVVANAVELGVWRMNEAGRAGCGVRNDAIGRRPLGEERLEFGLCLLERGAVFEASDHVQVGPSAVLRALRGIETKWDPYAHALIVNIKGRRHDADDRAPHAIDLQLLANHRMPAERALPEFVREHDDERTRSALFLQP